MSGPELLLLTDLEHEPQTRKKGLSVEEIMAALDDYEAKEQEQLARWELQGVTEEDRRFTQLVVAVAGGTLSFMKEEE